MEHASRPPARRRNQHRRRGSAVRWVEHERLLRGRGVPREQLLQGRPGDARLAELGRLRPQAQPLRVGARAGHGVGRSLDADDRSESAGERQREQPVAAVEVPEAAAAAEQLSGDDSAITAGDPEQVIPEEVANDLPDGRYTVRVEFPGFQTAELQDVRVRGGGETRRRITLQIQKLDASVTVSRDRQSSSLDPGGSAFSTVLTREQIAALPDDPEEMEEALKGKKKE